MKRGRKKKYNYDKVVVGGYMSKALADKLALYSVAKHTYRSSIISKVLEQFFRNVSTEQLIRETVDYNAMKWELLRARVDRREVNKAKKQYIKDLREAYHRRGLPEKIINEIVTRL